ncbi:hypothetical protein G5I_12103 [Acromyrmex echinatior]|uniref:Uncharacterized protein n=1 Tax=Acromyrmex echinatior TaxID=103372 RepID=F4X1H3_ACREC|nr:hypothetical protein G5I_12103 [Acromyrmex echinatior]
MDATLQSAGAKRQRRVLIRMSVLNPLIRGALKTRPLCETTGEAIRESRKHFKFEISSRQFVYLGLLDSASTIDSIPPRTFRDCYIFVAVLKATGGDSSRPLKVDIHTTSARSRKTATMTMTMMGNVEKIPGELNLIVKTVSGIGHPISSG